MGEQNVGERKREGRIKRSKSRKERNRRTSWMTLDESFTSRWLSIAICKKKVDFMIFKVP